MAPAVAKMIWSSAAPPAGGRLPGRKDSSRRSPGFVPGSGSITPISRSTLRQRCHVERRGHQQLVACGRDGSRTSTRRSDEPGLGAESPNSSRSSGSPPRRDERRDVRAHQARGLLNPPEVRQRVGYWPRARRPARLITELQADGFNLKGIERLLATRGSLEAMLTCAAVTSPFEDERTEMVTVASSPSACPVIRTQR